MRRAGADGASARAGTRTRLALGGCIAVSAVAAAGCGGLRHHDDMANGKQQFVARCGSCHTLARAGTKGVSGPNLDEAFARARRDGMTSSTFAGMVHRQIEMPSRLPQTDPKTGKRIAFMPANLVKGEDARDVAAYVGTVAGAGGKDTGRLASIGMASAKGTAREVDGVLDIPADPSGQLAYQFANARASAGKLTLESKNPSPTGHNIAIEGNGVDAKGPVVKGGAVSKLSVTVKPGTYTFYCSVPGHREGGMRGRLTVR